MKRSQQHRPVHTSSELLFFSETSCQWTAGLSLCQRNVSYQIIQAETRTPVVTCRWLAPQPTPLSHAPVLMPHFALRRKSLLLRTIAVGGRQWRVETHKPAGRRRVLRGRRISHDDGPGQRCLDSRGSDAVGRRLNWARTVLVPSGCRHRSNDCSTPWNHSTTPQ